jgi:glycerol-3-phosphate dehydrogenase (NAD(P)+)
MKIVVIGGGSFGTALANELAHNTSHEVTILLRDKTIETEINQNHSNPNYFLNKKLNAAVSAAADYRIIKTADIVIIAIPTRNISDVTAKMKDYLAPSTLVINGSKGILREGITVVDFLKKELNHQSVVSLKGASFSSEIMNHMPTLFTVGFESKKQLDIIHRMIADTNLFVDYTTDIRGVEMLSALKNIYAILLGNIDAKFNAANTRFLILTKAISELKIILRATGGKEETIFLSCGIGDTSLTALNDLSRNRTLGLLIGKGFYNASFDDNSVVLEGIKTLRFVDSILSKDLKKRLPLLNEMLSLFVKQKEPALDLDFRQLFEKHFTTVLTYGTFDLLHFGHLEILRRAKALGDRLIVGLSTEEFNREKGKNCEFSFKKRKLFLESLSYVDMVIPETKWEQKRADVINHDIDIFVMGEDWKGKFNFLKEYCRVKYLPRTKGISTTKIKSIIKDEYA